MSHQHKKNWQKEANMKIGIDYHGVIDTYPDIFRDLTHKWHFQGHQIHIITGKEWALTEAKVNNFQITYTHHFSIVDYHQQKGTHMIKTEKGWWMEDTIWDKSKGEYCKRESISIHFDNDLDYAKWFPEKTTFILVRKTNFEEFVQLITP